MFITTKCNMHCPGCFARNIKATHEFMPYQEYFSGISDAKAKGCQQINILGGEPLLHPNLKTFLRYNKSQDLKTTIYTNGTYLSNFKPEDFTGVKLRVSVYSTLAREKGAVLIPNVGIPFDANFMVSKGTTLYDMMSSAEIVETRYHCKVFFISSIRELDNYDREFFKDTERTMPVLQYKKLVHDFLINYKGNMDIHISKRGVFESTVNLPFNQCRFANYFIDGKIIQCPYDIVNLRYQKGYTFGERFCKQNNTCLMSKIKLRPIRRDDGISTKA